METVQGKPESSIILLIILIAIILAIGVFLAVSMLFERSNNVVAEPTLSAGSQTYTVNVEGQTITLPVDPNQQPVVVAATAVPPPADAAQSQETVQPAAQPEAAQSEQPVPQTQVEGAGGQPAAARLMFINYVVVAGDTLYRIQEKNITSIALMAKYGISSTDIVVGNVLNLPVGNVAACNGWYPYVVLQGDTSFGISQRYGISLEQFGSVNGLDANYAIYETDIVCVP
jgi:LysM repeat protein